MPKPTALSSAPDARYRDEFVQSLFDRMGPTYDAVNLLSSFGFSRCWRRICVKNAAVAPGDRVCDMMAGSIACVD
jgi:demethylmenaquinone methyltransferase/2-methoxy-6-polyprenyl-1,4-benzoquinol methylase